ncbi:MAG: hypothetical protein KAH44_01940, partial [Oricola sp.]|nr:hypothetical protein [Oricola sp.]
FALLAAVAGFALAQSGATASAALLAYDPFNIGPGGYVAGDEAAGTNVLGGQNPVIGPTPFYNGAWIQSGGDSQAVKDIGSLENPLFPQSGGQVQETVQFSCCSFGRSAREIAGGLGGELDPYTIYQSFLIDFGSQGTDDATQFGKRAYEMWNGGVGDAFLAVDLFVNHFAGVNELTLQVTTASGTQSVALNGGGLDLEDLLGTHLVVFRFDFSPGAADVVRVYLDPTTSIEADFAAAAMISVAASDLLISHHGAFTGFTFSGGGHLPGAFDEVRWGETFADVTPFLSEVPVPPAMALFAAGLLGAPLLRRRKRIE